MTATIAENTITNNQHLVDQLKRFATFEEFRNSEFYGEHETELRRLLDEPRVYEQMPLGLHPRVRARLEKRGGGRR